MATPAFLRRVPGGLFGTDNALPPTIDLEDIQNGHPISVGRQFLSDKMDTCLTSVSARCVLCATCGYNCTACMNNFIAFILSRHRYGTSSTGGSKFAEVKFVKKKDTTRLEHMKATIQFEAGVLLKQVFDKFDDAAVALEAKFGESIGKTEFYKVVEAAHDNLLFDTQGGQDNRVGKPMGIYARNQEIGDKIFDSINVMDKLPDENEILHDMYMHNKVLSWSGITRYLAWAYSGMGYAGLHMENSDMAFSNWIPYLKIENMTDEESRIVKLFEAVSVLCQ